MDARAIVLIGAGGHAKAIVEALRAMGCQIAAYVDAAPADWLPGVERFASDNDYLWTAAGVEVVPGLGGVTVIALERRMTVIDRYHAAGLGLAVTRHPASIVSESATVGAGAVLLAGSVVQPGASIGPAAIINTGAIVEHDSRVEEGAHVGPGAIVLGGCHVGRCAMVGAGAVVLPQTVVAARTLVRAASRYPEPNAT